MQEHRSRSAATRSPEEAFGQVLRELRKARGISQEELAFRSGYHFTYIGQLERGKKSPSLRAITRLAAALGTRGSDILRNVEQLVLTN